MLWLSWHVKSGLPSSCWDFSLYDAPRSGRPVEVDSNQTETLIESNQHYTTREIADILQTSKSSAENHLHQLGYVNRFDVWVPLKLSQKNLSWSHFHMWFYWNVMKVFRFLKQIVTGNEKWILFNNVERKRSWDKRNEPPPATPKASLHPKRVMLCIWWDWMGVLYYELLPENHQSFQEVLLPVRPTESSTQWKASRISQQKCINLHSG